MTVPVHSPPPGPRRHRGAGVHGIAMPAAQQRSGVAQVGAQAARRRSSSYPRTPQPALPTPRFLTSTSASVLQALLIVLTWVACVCATSAPMRLCDLSTLEAPGLLVVDGSCTLYKYGAPVQLPPAAAITASTGAAARAVVDLLHQPDLLQLPPGERAATTNAQRQQVPRATNGAALGSTHRLAYGFCFRAPLPQARGPVGPPPAPPAPFLGPCRPAVPQPMRPKA